MRREALTAEFDPMSGNGGGGDSGNGGGHTLPAAPPFPSLKHEVSAAEWATRVDLAACYRLLKLYGLDDLIYNHVTARVPGTEHVLINPFGFFYDEVSASGLVKIDLDGNILGGPPGARINHAGFVIHSAVHGARHDVQCVAHTHTVDNMAVSAMTCGLLPYTITALRFHGRIAYHDFEGPAVDLGERARLAAHLGPHNAMILRNHGALTCGRTIAEAFFLMLRLELSCRTQVKYLAANTPLQQLSQASMERSRRVFAPPQDGNGQALGDQSYALEWEAVLRQLNRRDSAYST